MILGQECQADLHQLMQKEQYKELVHRCKTNLSRSMESSHGFYR